MIHMYRLVLGDGDGLLGRSLEWRNSSFFGDSIKVTFLSSSWRSLNHLKGHLTIPERSRIESPGKQSLSGHLTTNWLGGSTQIEISVVLPTARHRHGGIISTKQPKTSRFMFVVLLFVSNEEKLNPQLTKKQRSRCANGWSKVHPILQDHPRTDVSGQ